MKKKLRMMKLREQEQNYKDETENKGNDLKNKDLVAFKKLRE